MINKTAILYTEWLPLIENQPNEDMGEVFKSILKYQNGDDVICDNIVWLFIKNKLDEYNNKYDDIRKNRAISGSKGGLAKASKSYQMLASASKCKQNLANLATKQNKTEQNKILYINGESDSECDDDLFAGSNNKPTPLPPLPNDYEEKFIEWYNHYPKHVSKEYARKCFIKVLKDKKATFDELISGADKYSVKVKGKDEQYIMHPATWLNRGCWEDGDNEKDKNVVYQAIDPEPRRLD